MKFEKRYPLITARKHEIPKIKSNKGEGRILYTETQYYRGKS